MKTADMESIGATEASNRFGGLLDSARYQPIKIEKQGRPVAVMMAIEEYERMTAEMALHETRRLEESITDMETGNTVPAAEAFEELKNRYR